MITKKQMSKLVLLLGILLMISIVTTACFPGNIDSIEKKPAGFFLGIWHGWIAPVSLIVRLFNSEVRIYEVHNSGWWYEFGFYIAIISGFGGLSLVRKKGKHDD